MSQITDLLSRVPLLRELDEDRLEQLAECVHRKKFRPGHSVVEIGDPGRSLYLIVEGEVQVLYPSRNADFELARLKPGDFFGEMALLNDKPRSATVRTVREVEALVLDKEDFRRVVEGSPVLALQLLAALSVRIRNADEQLSSLSDQAVHDPLTGLLNRRAFHDHMAREVDRARRYGVQFSLIVADVDEFKGINDTLGHDSGDEILRWIGRVLQEHTRAADSAFRIGGEEFAILCPSTGPEETHRVAERLVEVVAEARPPLDRELRVTMSAGYSSCPEHGASFEDLYYVGDQALLRAKEAGRNQVARPAVEDV